jgi:uncharacterized membrane protein YidH (DUF202 family)
VIIENMLRIPTNLSSVLRIPVTRARSNYILPTKRFFFGSSIIDNTGSMARDILATERTFLAWARTGLGFCGAGSALAAAYHRTGTVHIDVEKAAGLLIANGAFLLLFATRRYWTVLQALRNDKFVVNPGETLMAVAVTALSTIASLVLVWGVETSLKEKEKKKESLE